MSFLGLKPTFFKNGTSFSLHSSYLLKWQADQGKFHLFQHNIILYFKKPRDISVSSVKLLCEQQANLIKPGGLFASSPQSSSTTWYCIFSYSPSFLCSIKHRQCSPHTSMTGLGEQQHMLELLKARDPGQHSRTDHADTYWGHAPGWHFSAGLVSSNLLFRFWMFHAIYFCHTASSQSGVNSIMSEPRHTNWACLSLLVK